MSEAAESVLRRVTEVLPGNDELLAAAVEDSRLASVIEAYSDVNFIFGAQEADRTLYILVALLYLTDYENLRDLAASSALQAGELLLLSEFGKTLNAESLRDVEDDAEVHDFLNKLFEDFCNSLGIKVEHTSRSKDCKVPIRLDARPLKPARPCQSPRLHDRAVPVPGPRQFACPRDVPARTRSLFELMDMVTLSSRFVSLPSNAWKILGAIDRSLESHLPGEQAAVLQSLRDFAVQAYSQAVFDGRAWEVDDFEPACLPLRAAEARELLLAREQSEAVKCLVFKRPSSFLSDEMVVADGAERARLYLVQAGLRVSYNLPLTYGMLGTGDEGEHQVMHELVTESPSPIDKVLRQYTLNNFCFYEGASYVLNLAPEDYKRAGLNMNSIAADVYSKIPFPVGLKAEKDVPLVGFALSTVNAMLDRVGRFESARRCSWLFPHGQPRPDEMLRVFISHAE